jgi:hypothetical protein
MINIPLSQAQCCHVVLEDCIGMQHDMMAILGAMCGAFWNMQQSASMMRQHLSAAGQAKAAFGCKTQVLLTLRCARMHV